MIVRSYTQFITISTQLFFPRLSVFVVAAVVVVVFFFFSCLFVFEIDSNEFRSLFLLLILWWFPRLSPSAFLLLSAIGCFARQIVVCFTQYLWICVQKKTRKKTTTTTTTTTKEKAFDFIAVLPLLLLLYWCHASSLHQIYTHWVCQANGADKQRAALLALRVQMKRKRKERRGWECASRSLPPIDCRTRTATIDIHRPHGARREDIDTIIKSRMVDEKLLATVHWLSSGSGTNE